MSICTRVRSHLCARDLHVRMDLCVRTQVCIGMFRPWAESRCLLGSVPGRRAALPVCPGGCPMQLFVPLWRMRGRGSENKLP